MFKRSQRTVPIARNTDPADAQSVHVETFVVGPGIGCFVIGNIEAESKIVDRALVEGVHPRGGEVDGPRFGEGREVWIDILAVPTGLIPGQTAEEPIGVAEVMVDSAKEQVGVDGFVDRTAGRLEQGIGFAEVCPRDELVHHVLRAGVNLR